MKKRLHEIDFTKGVLMLSVVVFHLGYFSLHYPKFANCHFENEAPRMKSCCDVRHHQTKAVLLSAFETAHLPPTTQHVLGIRGHGETESPSRLPKRAYHEVSYEPLQAILALE